MEDDAPPPEEDVSDVAVLEEDSALEESPTLEEASAEDGEPDEELLTGPDVDAPEDVDCPVDAAVEEDLTRLPDGPEDEDEDDTSWFSVEEPQLPWTQVNPLLQSAEVLHAREARRGQPAAANATTATAAVAHSQRIMDGLQPARLHQRPKAFQLTGCTRP